MEVLGERVLEVALKLDGEGKVAMLSFSRHVLDGR